MNYILILSFFPLCFHFFLEIVIFRNSIFCIPPSLHFADTFCFWLLKLSWSKKLVRKWFNIKGKTEEFQSDEVVYGGLNQFPQLLCLKKPSFSMVNWGFLEIMSTWIISLLLINLGESFIFSVCLLFQFGGGCVDGKSHILS